MKKIVQAALLRICLICLISMAVAAGAATQTRNRGQRTPAKKPPLLLPTAQPTPEPVLEAMPEAMPEPTPPEAEQPEVVKVSTNLVTIPLPPWVSGQDERLGRRG